MDADEVLVHAYSLWEKISSYSDVKFYTDETEIGPYDAEQALKGLQRREPDDPVWEELDWQGMTVRFIDYINYRLQRKGQTYEQVMDERRQALAATATG